ncbi:hypothetical protein HN014_19195 [Aquimarina sp. TRL1]|uniref:hypothetical protein n=1 Tax=Aquimarina sp. (strain TRL1) TaxID=2736252 RepID=UPI001588FA17|nr:hypothetical protein [Aquimarina sp. TRL1]QKX06953.1 hypothetical protein HN014_19195 [Aquimarina sp. TRL1]
MEIVIYLGIGIVVTILGAIPLGTVNLSVIHTTIEKGKKEAFKIIIAAGVAELLLAFYAIYCNITIDRFIHQNRWIHYLLVFVFLVVGLLFMTKKTKQHTKRRNLSFTKNKYLIGFLLGVFNPPVLFFWILTISSMKTFSIELNKMTASLLLLFFGLGVYIGKTGTLYMYSKMALYFGERISFSQHLNKVIGILLLFIAFFQGSKIFLFD